MIKKTFVLKEPNIDNRKMVKLCQTKGGAIACAGMTIAATTTATTRKMTRRNRIDSRISRAAAAANPTKKTGNTCQIEQ
jgi:hypothetical protein